MPLQRARALQQPPSAGTADEIAEVVAGDRAGGRSRDDPGDVEHAVVGEHAASDERGLTRHGHAGGLRGDEREEDEIAQMGGEMDERRGHGPSGVDSGTG